MIRKLALALATTAGAILACEALLALAGVSSHPPLYPGDVTPVEDQTFDPWIGWKMPPEALLPETTEDYSVTYRSNRQGFRSRREFEVESGVRRIVFLGDSFTFGSGVEEDETFAALLEARLGGARSYNLGIGGFGIDQMWRTLVHYGLPLEPDLVILAFIRNDLDRSLSAYRLGHAWLQKPTYRLVDGRLAPLTVGNLPPAAWRWVERRSRLVELWRRAESSLALRYAVGYRWRLNRALFAAVRDECRQAGVPLVVVHLPLNRRSAAPLLEREFAELEVPFLDLTPLLPPDADRLYYPRDHHFNAAGHRFVAEAIHRFLAARRLTPSSVRRI